MADPVVIATVRKCSFCDEPAVCATELTDACAAHHRTAHRFADLGGEAVIVCQMLRPYSDPTDQKGGTSG